MALFLILSASEYYNFVFITTTILKMFLLLKTPSKQDLLKMKKFYSKQTFVLASCL